MSSFITFKQYLIIAERFNILLEGRIQDDVYRILTNGGYGEEQLPDVYNQLNGIVARYNTQKHLPMLAKYFIDEGPDTSVIRSYYNRFMANPKLRNLDIFQFKTFRDFEQKIDSTATPVDKQAIKKINDKPVYEDENVKIYYGSDKNRCIKYGQGKRFGFCISQDGPSNLFHGYRKDEATFYFVYFKNDTAQADAPAEIIVIHAYPHDRYQINYAEPNRDTNIESDEIEDQFPVLAGLVGPGKVIKHQGHTDDEKKEFEIRNTRRMFDLKTKDEQLKWLEFHPNEDISINDFERFDEDHVAKYIEASLEDLPIFVLERYPKYIPRYKEKRLQLLGIMLDSCEQGVPDAGRITEHMFTVDKDAVVNIINNCDDLSKLECIDLSLENMVREPSRQISSIEYDLYVRDKVHPDKLDKYRHVIDALLVEYDSFSEDEHREYINGGTEIDDLPMFYTRSNVASSIVKELSLDMLQDLVDTNPITFNQQSIPSYITISPEHAIEAFKRLDSLYLLKAIEDVLRHPVDMENLEIYRNLFIAIDRKVREADAYFRAKYDPDSVYEILFETCYHHFAHAIASYKKRFMTSPLSPTDYMTSEDGAVFNEVRLFNNLLHQMLWFYSNSLHKLPYISPNIEKCNLYLCICHGDKIREIYSVYNEIFNTDIGIPSVVSPYGSEAFQRKNVEYIFDETKAGQKIIKLLKGVLEDHMPDFNRLLDDRLQSESTSRS